MNHQFQLRDAIATLNREALAGEFVREVLRRLPRTEWRDVVAANPAWRSFGTVDLLLRDAHDQLERDPSRSRALTVFVLRHLLPVDVPDGLRPLYPRLVGIAWKEYANVCITLDRFKAAIRAAERAYRIFCEDPHLGLEAATATFIIAQAKNGLKDRQEALVLLARCEETFQTFGDAEHLLQVIMMRGLIKYECGEFHEALDEFLMARAEAARQRNQRDLAKTWQGLGACALKLERPSQAMEYLQEAILRFMQLGFDAEVDRTQWLLARAVKTLGDPERAISEYARAAEQCRTRGMTRMAKEIDEERAEVKL
jgi:tetratricopeptide (TPR) repeat protein